MSALTSWGQWGREARAFRAGLVARALRAELTRAVQQVDEALLLFVEGKAGPEAVRHALTKARREARTVLARTPL